MLLFATAAVLSASPASLIKIVAAENFYGDVVRQIGRDRVSVISIMSDPNVDPSEYQSNAKCARAVAIAEERAPPEGSPRHAIAGGLIRLSKSGGSFSAEDLLRKLRRTNPRIGRATVYRSLEKLVRMRVLDRIEFADGRHSFRICDTEHHHHHLTCTKCRRVIELDFCLQANALEAIRKHERFEIEGHSITLFGLCKDCR